METRARAKAGSPRAPTSQEQENSVSKSFTKKLYFQVKRENDLAVV